MRIRSTSRYRAAQSPFAPGARGVLHRRSSMRCRVPAAEVGQALVETLVALLALVPLLLAIPLIAKYQDIRIAATAASRTAAFECSVRFETCTEPADRAALEDALRRRHFARHARDLPTLDAIAADAPADERNRFWVDRRGQALLGSLSDVTLQVDAAPSDAIVGALTGSRRVEQGLSAWSEAAGPGAFGLEPGTGLVTARTSARVSAGRTVAQWLARPEGIELTLSGRTALLVDPWNASSATGSEPRSFAARVEQGRRLPSLGDVGGLLAAAANAPAGVLAPGAGGGEVEPLIDALYAPVRELITGPLLAPVEPRGRLFRYHEIDVELVPEDRLGEAR